MSDLLRPYRLLATAFHGGILRRAGEILMLAEGEVGAHHQLIEPEKPAAKLVSKLPAAASAVEAKPTPAPKPEAKTEG